MTHQTRRRFQHGLAVGLTCALCLGGLQATGWLAPLELRAYDARARLLADPGQADPRILLVLIDQPSLDYFADEQGFGWPWPRSLYEPILRLARHGGARAILFDIYFSELSVFGPEDDAALGAALGERRDAAVAVGLQRRPPENEPPSPPGGEEDSLERFSIPVRDAARLRREGSPEVMEAILPVPEILGPVARVGNVEFPADPDGVFRRIPIYSWFRGRPQPSLFTAGARLLEPEAEWRRTRRGLRLGDRFLEGDPEEGLLLRYRGPSQTYRSLRAAGVIRSWLLLQEGRETELDPTVFRDAVVLVGMSAPGLLDLRPSPVDRKHYGVEIHATALDCLLQGDFIRPALMPWLWTALTALAVGLGSSLIPRARFQILLLALLLVAGQGLALASYQAGRDAPQAFPALAALISFVAASVVSYAREGRQKTFIKSAFRQYLSPQVIERILEDPSRLTLGGERRELTIFFSDLEAFTSISEGMDPHDLTELLNDYLSEMSEIILTSGGTVDKYEGDAIIAFWNAPLDQPDHPVRGVRAALECQRRLEELQDDYSVRAGRLLRMRIGLHTGTVIVGNLGSRDRFDYTVLGDAANLASRLEGVNKVFGTSVLLSESTWEAAREVLGNEVAAREIGRVQVKGRTMPVRIFEPVLAGRATAGVWERFARGLDGFTRGEFDSAMTELRQNPDDPPSRAYIQRCRLLAAEPPESWNGVWVLESK